MKSKKKSRLRILLYLSGVVVILALIAGSYFMGDIYAVESMTTAKVTPDQVANAMKNDNFYSNYRQNTLLLDGVVAFVSTQGSNSIVGFKTTSTYMVSCEFSGVNKPFNIGNPLSVISEGGSAERLANGVLLKNCVIPN